MREDLCSIPILDVFSPQEGCPICRMRDMLEDRMATYITGAAMMEPDVRIETNRLGFCSEHFNQILARGSRLSVALILESLLQAAGEEVIPQGKVPPKKTAAARKQRLESCFICDNLEKNTAHLLDSMLKLWQSDAEFRTLYRKQEYLCLPHYHQVLEAAQKMPKKNYQPFEQDTTALFQGNFTRLQEDVTHFCRMFDYRNAGGDWGNSKDAIERAIRCLTAREPENRQKADEKNR